MSLGLFSALDTPARRWTFGEVPDLSIGDADEATLRTQAEQHLARYKQPRRYEFVGEIPRNAMGKVQKSHLRSR